MYRSKDTTKGQAKTADHGCMEEEVFNLCSQSQTKTQRAVEAYCRLRSVSMTATECRMSVSSVMVHLTKERDKRGLSDIRFLYADAEDEFNDGNNDSDSVRQSDLMNLVESQHYRCALSGIELTPETAALDHITPVANGGEHAIGNLQWLNSEVNRMKGMLSVDVFIDICKRVAATAGGNDVQGTPPLLGPLGS